jgi:LmbE family N-acetylglucosaminyl deacetylase
VLVLAPHQDDETLGCGGMIRIRRDEGADVHVAFLTDGMTSGAGEKLVGVRRNEAESAMALLGVDGPQVTFLGFPDGALRPQAASAMHDVLGLLRAYEPNEVFVTARTEPHADHAAAAEITLGAIERWDRPVVVNEYPIWSWYQWPWMPLPLTLDAATRARFLRLMRSNARTCGPLRLLREFAYVLDVDGVAQHKQAAIEQYSSQLDPPAGEPSLRDLGGGEFLEIFRSGREHFRRTVFD